MTLKLLWEFNPLHTGSQSSGSVKTFQPTIQSDFWLELYHIFTPIQLNELFYRS